MHPADHCLTLLRDTLDALPDHACAGGEKTRLILFCIALSDAGFDCQVVRNTVVSRNLLGLKARSMEIHALEFKSPEGQIARVLESGQWDDEILPEIQRRIAASRRLTSPTDLFGLKHPKLSDDWTVEIPVLGTRRDASSGRPRHPLDFVEPLCAALQAYLIKRTTAEVEHARPRPRF